MDLLLEYLVEMRVSEPERVLRLAQARIRRAALAPGGRLVLVAADHVARRVVEAGQDPWAMADRLELLRRLAAVLMQPGVDGVLGTPDLIEELFLVAAWAKERGLPDFLAGKVLIGSINRTGLKGSAFEQRDEPSAYSVTWLRHLGLDGGKLLLRLDLTSPDTLHTLLGCARALEELAEAGLWAFLEALAVPPTTDELVRAVGVASGLGPTCLRRWLKLPMAEDFGRVARATACPILLLGGDTAAGAPALLDAVERCLAAGPNVRGVLMGRGVLYPHGSASPVDVARELVVRVHGTRHEEVDAWRGL